jgi:molybdenum cofactor sulfurtransferase
MGLQVRRRRRGRGMMRWCRGIEFQSTQPYVVRLPFSKRIASHLPRFGSDACYLDNSAAPPYPHSLIKSYTAKLTSPSTLYGNPHSQSPSSLSTSSSIDAARAQVLRRLFHVQAEEGWAVVFTSGATASLKLVAECFDWREGGKMRYCAEAHTSVVGLRDIACERGGVAQSFLVREFEDGTLAKEVGESRSTSPTLVGMPLQCNATGRKYDIETICNLKSQPASSKTYLLLDAAAYLSAHQTLDLSQIPYDSAPDFIAFSFYKIFGFPTGLGGLVVKRSAIDALSQKTYYGGGTLDAITAEKSWRVPRKDFVARMEDGTGNFHGILAVSCGFEVFDRMFGVEEERRRHVMGMTRRLVRSCALLRHGNGELVCRIYSTSEDLKSWSNDSDDRVNEVGDQGATIAFNLLTANGTIVPPTEVDRLACIQNIHLRAGRHCNAGVITSQVGATEVDLIEQYRSGMGCDESANGAVVSATVRVSLNVANTRQDVDRFVGFIRRFFVQTQTPGVVAQGVTAPPSTYHLRQLLVYPIKSCAAQHIQPGQRWPLTPEGLRHDREWVLVDTQTGKALSQKKHHRMALIRSTIDLETQMMQIAFGGTVFSVSISLPRIQAVDQGDFAICGESAAPTIHQDPLLNQTLSEFLGLSCALARQPTSTRHSKLATSGHQASDRIPLLLSNESPFLLINRESVESVSTWMSKSKGRPPREAKTTSFRGNFTIDSVDATGSPRPFTEDSIEQVTIGPHVFSALGQCRRCQMVAIDQETGEHAPDTFLALAKHRRNERGRIVFGVHLTWRKDLQGGEQEEEGFVEVGMPVRLHF